MRIKTIQADSVTKFRERFSLLTGEGFKPSVAIIFISIGLEIQEVMSILKTHQVRTFGSSSCGEFLFDADRQDITEGAMVCTLLEIPPDSFEIMAFGKESGLSFDMGEKIGKWVSSAFADPALLIVASGLETDGEQLVRGIQNEAGEGLTMFGGLAGDDAEFKKTVVFTENQFVEDGAVTLVLDKSRFEVQGLATSGWVGIGADKTITESDGNIVYTIDGEPALDVYTSYLNVNERELPQIGVEYPLLLKKEGSPDVLRAVINVDREKRSLIFAGSVPKGSLVTFSSSPGFEIIESTRNTIQEFFTNTDNPDLLILFSCMARHMALGPSISEEITEAWQSWQKPLIGFFTYGEIGSNFQSRCDFHNETFTMVSIREV
jgi:hypothetical protein